MPLCWVLRAGSRCLERLLLRLALESMGFSAGVLVGGARRQARGPTAGRGCRPGSQPVEHTALWGWAARSPGSPAPECRLLAPSHSAFAPLRLQPALRRLAREPRACVLQPVLLSSSESGAAVCAAWCARCHGVSVRLQRVTRASPQADLSVLLGRVLLVPSLLWAAGDTF